MWKIGRLVKVYIHPVGLHQEARMTTSWNKKCNRVILCRVFLLLCVFKTKNIHNHQNMILVSFRTFDRD